MDGKKRSVGGTKEKRAPTKAGTKKNISGKEPQVRQEWCEGGNNTKSINVSIDPDVLDCSICFAPLRPPLFQCHNGHVVCYSCCAELQKKCHICSLPTGDSRCRALETIIEALKIPCPHSTFGCPESIPYTQKDTHEASCSFAPCSCPVSSCTFRGPTTLLSDHIQNEHQSTTPQISFFCEIPFQVALQQKEPFYVLHGEDGRVFLLLNAGNVPRGSCLSIVCIKPGSMELDVGYDIVVKRRRSELRLRASPRNIRELKVASPAESFLFVPYELGDSTGEISIDVRFWNM